MVRGGDSVLFPVHSSPRILPVGAIQESSGNVPFWRALENSARPLVSRRAFSKRAPLNRELCLLIDSTRTAPTRAIRHKSFLRNARHRVNNKNALNLLPIPIVNPRVSRVMKHRPALFASEGNGAMFPEIAATFPNCIANGKCRRLLNTESPKTIVYDTLIAPESGFDQNRTF